MLCSQRALILVLEYVGNFGVRLRQIAAWLQPLWQQLFCHRMTNVSKMYATSMLCCHCWMFSLSDALPMQSYPSKVWVLCQCGRAA